MSSEASGRKLVEGLILLGVLLGVDRAEHLAITLRIVLAIRDLLDMDGSMPTWQLLVLA